nr:hypothetical protein [uncultured Flavobacterium sp.]
MGLGNSAKYYGGNPLSIPVRYGLCDNGNGIVTAAAPPFYLII